MSITRQFLFSTLIFALLPPAIVHGAPSAVEYVGGTVKSVPANTTGWFNFDDNKELRFTYGESVYKLPYTQITSTDIVKGETHHILRRIPVPSLMPGRQRETLTIAYKDAAGASGTLNFQLAASQAWAARDTIAAKKSAAEAAAAGQSAQWWGDKLWKTNRNKGTWEAGEAQSAPAGTQ